MKKLIYILFTCFLFGCVKHDVDLVFDELPEARMLARNQELQNKLSESPGWEAFLRTSLNGTGYGFYMTFDSSSGQVTMYSDWSTAYATTPKISTYRIIYEMNTTLTFDTYNYISIMQDPNASVNGGSSSTGLRSDIEFAYIRSTADTIVLKGKHYSNYLYLIKASTSNATKYTNGGYATAISSFNSYFNSHSNNYVVMAYNGSDVKMGVTIASSSKTLSFMGKSGDSTISGSTSYGYAIDGVYFTDAITILGKTYIAIRYKEDGYMYIVDSEGKEYQILQNATPLLAMSDLFGYNKTYNSIYSFGTAYSSSNAAVSASLPTGVTSDFNTEYNGLISRFAANSRYVDTVEFKLSSSTTALVRIWYWSGSTHYLADASFTYTYINGVITLSNYTESVSNTNWTTRITQIGSFVTWLQSGPFNANWVTSTTSGSPTLAGLYKTTKATDFYYGRVRKSQ